MKIALCFLALICSLISFQCIIAAEEDAEEVVTTTEEATNTTAEKIIGPSPDIVTSFVFPDSPELKQFVPGRQVRVIAALKNIGQQPVNVTALRASLMYPLDFRYYIQNYTKQAVYGTVPPGQQVSFLYIFFPDAMLEPREFGLTAQVWYNSEADNYTSVFYNNTIQFVEDNTPFDVQTLFTYVGVLGGLGLFAFIVLRSVGAFGSSKKSRRPAQKIEMGTQANTQLDSEWLEGTFANVGTKTSPKTGRKQKSS